MTMTISCFFYVIHMKIMYLKYIPIHNNNNMINENCKQVLILTYINFTVIYYVVYIFFNFFFLLYWVYCYHSHMIFVILIHLAMNCNRTWRKSQNMIIRTILIWDAGKNKKNLSEWINFFSLNLKHKISKICLFS